MHRATHPFDASRASGTDPDDEYDDFGYLEDTVTERRRRRHARDESRARRLVAEGRSGHIAVDTACCLDDVGTDDHAAPLSSYDLAIHGPEPAPGWLVTAFAARDTSRGALKSGKEADVGLLERAVPGGPSCLLAVKTYRSADHRMFHRDAGYQEGRRVRRSRESRAMAKRTGFGRALLAAKWADAEFAALCRLWTAGARVPYPVQILGSELMMQFIGTADGLAAPRLSAYDGDTATFTDLWHDLVASLEVLALEGLTHGDLSPYNVLVAPDGCVLIDLPQVVDIVGNPQGVGYLRRDCEVIASFFARRGVPTADDELLFAHLAGLADAAGLADLAGPAVPPANLGGRAIPGGSDRE